MFLDGVTGASAQAERTIVKLATLIANDRRKLLAPPKAGAIAYSLFKSLPMMLRISVEQIKQRLATSYPSTNAAVKAPSDLEIVLEVTGQRNNRSFGYQSYIAPLSR